MSGKDEIGYNGSTKFNLFGRVYLVQKGAGTFPAKQDIRGKRKITLTEEGAFLRNRAQEILELIDNTESAFRTNDNALGGDITIGCGETAVMDVITQQFADFHRQYPDVKFHTHSGDADMVLSRLDKGLVDMGLLLGPIRQETI